MTFLGKKLDRLTRRHQRLVKATANGVRLRLSRPAYLSLVKLAGPEALADLPRDQLALFLAHEEMESIARYVAAGRLCARFTTPELRLGWINSWYSLFLHPSEATNFHRDVGLELRLRRIAPPVEDIEPRFYRQGVSLAQRTVAIDSDNRRQLAQDLVRFWQQMQAARPKH